MMTRRGSMLLLTLATLLLNAWELDFTRSRPEMTWWSNQKTLNRCSLAYATMRDGRTALRADWDAAITDYLHILHTFRPKLPEFRRLRARIRVTSDTPLQLTKCRFRLQDANFETFYWEQPVDFLRPGTQTLEWLVDAASPKPTARVQHGKDANARLDFPLSSVALTLDFPQNGVRGHLFVESFALEPLDAPEATATAPARPYPLEPMARPFIEPLAMPQRIPWPLRPGVCTLEAADNPVTGKPTLRMTGKDTSAIGVAFTTTSSPRGVLARKLGRQHGGELTVRLTTERAMPEVTTLQLQFFEAVGSPYLHSVPLKLDRAGEHRVTITLPSLVRTKKPWGSRDWQETPLFVLAGVRILANATLTAPICLDGIDARWSRSPLEALDLQLDTGNVAKVITPERAPQGVRATLANTAAQDVTLAVTGKLTDSAGKTHDWPLARTLTIPGGATADLGRIPVPAPFGTYYATVTVAADGHTPQTYTRSFAHFQPTGPTHEGVYTKGFHFGAVAHLAPFIMSPQAVREAAETMAQIGLRILRVDVGWSDNPILIRHVDHIVDTFLAQGMNFDFILPGIRQPKGVPQYNLAACLDGSRKLFERYKGKVQFWEMLNEPDIPWGPVEQAPKVDAYIELARKTADLLHDIDPQAKLMSAGWCTLADGARGMGPFHAPAMAALKDVLDIHAFHGHGPFARYAAHTIPNGLLAIRRKHHITIPWYANETALTSTGGVTERLQADALHKKLLYSWSRGAIGYTWYNLRSKGELPEDGEHNYGMMTWDFYPKAVYAAYNALTAAYRDKTFLQDFQLPAGQWALLFKGPHSLALALWNDDTTPRPRVIRTDATRAEIRDIFGNATPLDVRNGIVIATSTDETQTLLLQGASHAELLPPFVQLQTPPLLLPGQPHPVTIHLSNPFGEPRDLTLSLTLPETLAASQTAFTETIPPNSSRQLSLTLRLKDTTTPPRLAEQEWLLAEYDLKGLPHQRQMLTIPIPFLFDSRLDGQPHFTLNTHTSVVSLFVGDPAKEDSTWKGPSDLSAQIWLALRDNTLSLKAVVTDDQHCQRNADANRAWDGDSIQLFLMDHTMDTPIELDLARQENGDSHIFLRRMPPSHSAHPERLSLRTERSGNQTTYLFDLPLDAIGSSADALRRGLRLNLMVNDADNGIREGWVHLAPGVGYGHITPAMLPFFMPR